jgi:fumarate hydratase class II
MTTFRTERDSMGEMQVPQDALYGASTQRAVLNFPVSGRPMPPEFIHAIGYLKAACARANLELGVLSAEKARLIEQVSLEVAEGKFDAHFVVDVFQTGSCTSSNMNANEVIANRISQLSGEAIGSKKPVHPNDDVNMGQSSNDTMPTALHVSVASALFKQLKPALTLMHTALEQKAGEWKDVVKIGRTHCMDATPLTMGQVFSGYAMQVEKALERLDRALFALKPLAIGGTAVGTGINCKPGFAQKVCQELSQMTGLSFHEAPNHFEAQAGRDDCVEVAGLLTTMAAGLIKIANDIRLLGSGPRSGIGELLLPAVQPGSSIMPGKVNPVMCESLIQVGLYTMGLCQIVTQCGRDGQFELNTMIPLIAYSLLDSIRCLANGVTAFTKDCLHGLRVNESRCQELVERSLMLVTALNPLIGYDKAAYVAKKAYEENKTLREVVLGEKLVDEATLDQVLDPKTMVFC